VTLLGQPGQLLRQCFARNPTQSLTFSLCDLSQLIQVL
jgi:hypothetical protein